MHSMLSAQSEAPGNARPPFRTRSITGRLPTAVLLLFTLLCSAVSSFAQSALAPITTSVSGPTFVAIDGTTLYVSNHGDVPNPPSATPPANGGQILKFNLSNLAAAPVAIATRYDATTNPHGFISPDQIVVDPTTHDLFIADRYLNRVQRITNTGTFVMAWGSSTSGAGDEMHGPVSLALDGSGGIYVGEHGDTNGGGVNPHTVTKYQLGATATATPTKVWRTSNGLNTPYGLAVNGSSLLVSDGFNSRVQIWDLNGVAQGSFAINSSYIPLGLTMVAGNLWMTESTGNNDAGAQEVAKRNPTTGVASMTFGTLGSANNQLNLPFDVAVDTATNRAYVADYLNNRVAVWDLTPVTAVPSITSSSSASGTVGSAFSYQITATNSPTAYAQVSGTLPNGLSFSPSTGAITGTPTAAATATVGLTASNASGTSATFNLTITITSATVASPTLPAGPSITSFALDTTAGTIVQATGPLASHASMIVTFDTAVTGVDQSDFVITGPGQLTPVTAISSTQYRVNFNYTNDNPAYLQVAIKTSGTGITDGSANAFYGKGVTATSGTPIQNGNNFITPPSVASFTAGTPTASSVNFTLTFNAAVSGVSAGDFMIAKTGTIVPQIGAVSSADGGVTWTIPVTFTGTGAFELFLAGGATTNDASTAAPSMIYDGSGSSTSAVVTVGGGSSGAAPAITSATTANATAGAAFQYQIVATNSPTSYAATALSGTGLSINTSTGLISGTPTVAGTITTGISATNATGTGSATLTITVAAAGAAPTITSATSASATAGAAFSYQITATGSPTSYAATGLTGTGLSVNTATGAITGTPSAAGTITSTISATNASGTGSATLTITVAAAGVPPTITSSTSASATAGAAFNYQIAATGSPTSYAATNLSGTGLAVNTSTGAITGTPGAAGTITSSISATNAAGTGTATLTITVAAAGTPPTIAASQSTSGTVNTALNYQVVATGATTYAVNTGSSLPAGLAINSSTGVITGTPTASGTTTTAIRVSNANGSATGNVVITINPAIPTIPATQTAATGTIGASYNYQIQATNATNYVITAGTLPAGLALNAGTGAITGTPTAATAAAGATVTVQVSNASTATTASGNVVVVVNVAPPPTIPATQTAPATSVGFGFSYQIQATNTTNFTITSGTLPAGLTLNSSTGVISGSPTTATAASGATVTVRASNAGTATASGQVTIVVNSQPVSGGGGGGGGGGGTFFPPPPPPPPPAPSKSTQVIVFTSPVSSLFVGQPITLGATTNAGLPITYSVITGNATVSGNVLTINSTGTVVVRASSAGNDSWTAASSDVTFNAAKRAQAISFTVPASVTASAGKITLSATSDSGLPVTYTLVSGPASLSGNVLTLNGAAGTVTVRASQGGSDAFNSASDITRTFAINAAGQQVYFGTMGSDQFAAAIAQDSSRGTLVVRLAGTGEAIVAKFKVAADGSFSAKAASSTGVTRTITGHVVNGVLTGTVAELSMSFSATVQPPTGSTASLAGLYTSSIPGSASGNAYIVVGPAGQSFALMVTPSATASGMGTVSSGGAVAVSASNSTSIAATLGTDGAVNGTMTAGNATAAFVGLSDGVERTDKLINLSSRLRVTGGDASRSVIAGFVVTGSQPKKILVRAVGPGLTAFGVSGALDNPRLQLFDSSGKVIADNDDWSNNDEVSTTGNAVGAFKLDAGSHDAAIVTTLQPGAYTAQVTGVNSNGVVLIEVYDASTNAPIGTQQLINISTRGFVDTGDGNLIAGFVVTGNAPKRVLIRGVGPGLTQFGVTGALSDPVLKVYSTNNVLVAQNDNWGTPQAVSATQVAATAADISAAANATGAFPLPAGSKDAAIVITLMPGNYSAVVSGAADSTGAGLVEVYEIPNP